MAKKVQVVLIDDVDGGHADETVSFALDGTSYEIDLASHRAVQLRDALAPWVARARRSGTKSGRSGGSGGTGDAARIRAWAKGNGYAVPARGRIPADVRSAYESAN